jgi:hypothetical protein
MRGAHLAAAMVDLLITNVDLCVNCEFILKKPSSAKDVKSDIEIMANAGVMFIRVVSIYYI